VKAFAAELKSRGFKILLTVHYSDTWADPGHQATPVLWQALGFSVLKDSVGAYTKRIVQEINPEYIQLGNEINGGFLYPNGSSANPAQMLQLLQTAAAAVRSFAPATKIIIHYAGVSGAETFFNLITALDYDIIGISYYPVWHNITLENLAPVLKNFSTQFQKKIMVAETAYPFTLNWNDMTNNIVGLPAQLLSNYPASTEGQKNFLMAIRDLKNTVPSFTGFSYWGASLVAFKGTAATNGSPWENQSLWDFNLMAVPALGVFSN
jgi:arabinogalactan endo-1,4-beta-galactosidase